MTETFEPGELFVYRKAPGVYELGVVKGKRDERTYYCYYSTGDTAAATSIANMRKLVNARWAPIRWSTLCEGNPMTLDDLLCVIPGKHTVVVNANEVEAYRCHTYVGTAYNVPDCLRDFRVIGVRATDWMVDIEVLDD
jgi:hypothetical protein